MSGLMMSNENKGREYDIHPAGTFMAVCRDIWVERKPNPKYPGTTPYGKAEPQELVKVCIDFLTDEPIEINGQMASRFMRYKANMSWNEDANLRKFIRQWNPQLGSNERADIEVMVGKGAYLTIAHSVPGADGKVWANIVGIAAPPKGASIPLIPADFVRHKDKEVGPVAAGPGGAGAFDEAAPF